MILTHPSHFFCVEVIQEELPLIPPSSVQESEQSDADLPNLEEIVQAGFQDPWHRAAPSWQHCNMIIVSGTVTGIPGVSETMGNTVVKEASRTCYGHFLLGCWNGFRRDSDTVP